MRPTLILIQRTISLPGGYGFGLNLVRVLFCLQVLFLTANGNFVSESVFGVGVFAMPFVLVELLESLGNLGFAYAFLLRPFLMENFLNGCLTNYRRTNVRGMKNEEKCDSNFNGFDDSSIHSSASIIHEERTR